MRARDAAQHLVVARRLELTQQVLEAGVTRARRAAASLGFELDQSMRALICGATRHTGRRSTSWSGWHHGCAGRSGLADR